MGHQRKLSDHRDDGHVSPEADAGTSKKVFAVNGMKHSYQSDCVNYNRG